MNQPCSHLCRACTLLRRAFDGREHFRVVALEAASALQNQKLKTFYSNTGFIQPSALDRVSRDLPQLATGGTLAFTFFSKPLTVCEPPDREQREAVAVGCVLFS